MSDIDSDNLGEATPSDVAEAATAGDDVDVGVGEDAGTTGDGDADGDATMPGDQADAVVT